MKKEEAVTSAANAEDAANAAESMPMPRKGGRRMKRKMGRKSKRMGRKGGKRY